MPCCVHPQQAARTQRSHTEISDREGRKEVKPGSKSTLCQAQVVGQRLMKLDTKSAVAGAPAEVIIRRLKKSRSASGQVHESWEMVRARGHLTEVQNLRGTRRALLAPCGALLSCALGNFTLLYFAYFISCVHGARPGCPVPGHVARRACIIRACK